MTEQPLLDTLKRMAGSLSTKDDAAFQVSLDAAMWAIYDRIYVDSRKRPEVVEAILMVALRLYKRRQSPEGVAGWDDMGVVRIMARDPDVERLIEQHIDTYKVLGIA